MVLSAGQTKYYNTVSAESETYVDLYKLVETEDTENWNVKLEYPEHGHPIMTLKNATLNSAVGLYYGVGANVCHAPLTIVLEGDNKLIANASTGKYNSYHSALNFNTTADVTITSKGTGSLTIWDETYISAVATAEKGCIYIRYGGNLIFDNANIHITTTDEWPTTPAAVIATGADVTVNGGNITVIAQDPSSSSPQGNALGAAFKATKNAEGTAGGNITFQNGANVKVVASSHTLNTIVAEGEFTIKDSTVELAAVNQWYKRLFNKAPVLDFTNDDYDVLAATKAATYDAETEALTAPTANIFDTTAEDADWTQPLYFKVTPKATLTKFVQVGVNMQSNLTMVAVIPRNVTGTDGYVEFARNGVKENNTVSLANYLKGYAYIIEYPGITSKDMKDVITFTIYDKDGNQVSETRSISVYEYAMAQLAATENVKFKTLLVDLLNYGAMSQVNFGENPTLEDLANAKLTPEDWEYASANGTYGSAAATATANGGYINTGYVLQNSISMQMTVTAQYLGTNPTAVVTVEGVEGETVLKRDSGNNAVSWFVFDGMLPIYARSTITWKFYKAGEDPATAEPTLVVTDSLENFVGRNLAANPQYAAIMRYCDAATAYVESLAQ